MRGLVPLQYLHFLLSKDVTFLTFVHLHDHFIHFSVTGTMHYGWRCTLGESNPEWVASSLQGPMWASVSCSRVPWQCSDGVLVYYVLLMPSNIPHKIPSYFPWNINQDSTFFLSNSFLSWSHQLDTNVKALLVTQSVSSFIYSLFCKVIGLNPHYFTWRQEYTLALQVWAKYD